jgi:hypothetical protein
MADIQESMIVSRYGGESNNASTGNDDTTLEFTNIEDEDWTVGWDSADSEPDSGRSSVSTSPVMDEWDWTVDRRLLRKNVAEKLKIISARFLAATSETQFAALSPPLSASNWMTLTLRIGASRLFVNKRCLPKLDKRSRPFSRRR